METVTEIEQGAKPVNITRRSFVFAHLALSLPGVAHALSEVSAAGYASLRVDPIQAGNSALSATSLPNVDVAAQSLAPSGRLRVAINLGNSVLAQRNSAGFLTGASVTLAKLLAERLRVPLDTIAYPSAGTVFDALDHGAWDVAFLAVEPERALKVDFSPPYVSIDGTYLVRKDAPYQRVADLDRPGVRIAVGRGAAYDLYLKRTLKHAKLLRAINGAEAIKMYGDDRLDAAAGVRQVLAGYAKDKPELRVLSDAFSKIDQAIGVPKGHPAGAAYVRGVVEEMTASGQVLKALEGTA